MYHNPQAVVQVKGKRSEAFAIECSVWQGCPSFLFSVLALEPLFRRLRDRASPALRGVIFAGSLSAKVSAYVDDNTVFVSRCLNMKAVKNEVTLYEQMAGAKISFDKSEGLWLGAWRSDVLLPGPFCWSDLFTPTNNFGEAKGLWSVERSTSVQ